jgi:hypothetical protein
MQTMAKKEQQPSKAKEPRPSDGPSGNSASTLCRLLDEGREPQPFNGPDGNSASTFCRLLKKADEPQPSLLKELEELERKERAKGKAKEPEVEGKDKAQGD